jgi:peptidoglycan/xylan/chitin deacetylase (PgdA/CDA1 family)
MNVCITVDLEHDCPPFLHTYRGVKQGIPRLLELLKDEQVPATFFTTGDVARRFPDTLRSIVDGGHEIGCHGDTHRRFSTLDPASARKEIVDATATLRKYYPVTSFRAPNLDFPSSYVPFLRDAGYTLDSSEGRHKPGSFFKRPYTSDKVRRVPASTAPSVVRLPRLIRDRVFARLVDPVVFFFHPWEFVDVTGEPIPYDCRFKTGEPAIASLRETIHYWRARGAAFPRMGELARPAA